MEELGNSGSVEGAAPGALDLEERLARIMTAWFGFAPEEWKRCKGNAAEIVAALPSESSPAQGMREAVDLAVRPWQSGEPIMDVDDLRDLIQEYADADREYHSLPEGSPGEKGVLEARNEALRCAIDGFTEWVKYARLASLSHLSPPGESSPANNTKGGAA